MKTDWVHFLDKFWMNKKRIDSSGILNQRVHPLTVSSQVVS